VTFLSLSTNLTCSVLRTIGSPFAEPREEKCSVATNELYRYAVRNRMALLYLEALNRHKQLGFLDEEIQKLRERYARVTDAILRVSHVLRKSGVNYAFFKTVRPYKEVTVDIDILVFRSDYYQAVKSLQRTGYVLLEGDQFSTTFRDIGARLNVDIYNEVHVSRLIYLDKAMLEGFVVEKRLPDNEVVDCLNQVADLLCVIAHSVLKEQMYVLSEYYTSLNYLSQMGNADFSELLSLIEGCRLRTAVSAHLTATAFTHLFAHGSSPGKLAEILDEIGLSQRELSQICINSFSMPYKYHILTFVGALLEKLGEEKARRSVAHQVFNLLNPSFASSAIIKTFDHLMRETY